MALAARHGVSSLTLDAVAAEAGVSKGGLLYHFSTKEALLAGLVGAAMARWSDDVDAAAATDSEPAGRAARAYVTACDSDDDPARELALLAAAALDGGSVGAWRDAVRTWTEGEDDIDLLVTRLAADGMWLARALGLYDLDRTQIVAVTERLAALTRPEPAP